MSKIISFGTTDEVVITLKEITDILKVEHNKAMKKVDALTKEPSFGTVAKISTVYNNKGQTIETYTLNKKQAIAVGAKLNNSLLMQLIDKLEELEAEKKSKLPTTYKEALLHLIALEEEKEQLALENKHLEQTKAEIGHRREATAMNTASQKSKENEKLKQQLDESKKYSTIRKQEKIHSCKFKWNPLKKYCMENGLTIKDVPDDLYEFVKSYPAEAWQEVYNINIS
jgi:hypothetical protein